MWWFDDLKKNIFTKRLVFWISVYYETLIFTQQNHRERNSSTEWVIYSNRRSSAGVYSCCKSGVRGAADLRRRSVKPAAAGSAGKSWVNPKTRSCRIDQAGPWAGGRAEQTLRTAAAETETAEGFLRSLPAGRNVAEPGGSSAKKRSEALGDREEQRLLRPAEEERPRRTDEQVYR